MGGANVVHDEAADYTAGAASGASLNPLGQTVQAFYDFAVRRHPNRGTPFVPMAVMEAHESGLEPKYGEWMQGNAKWYWQSPYSRGDTMFANMLALVYPDYSGWGTLPAGAPKVLAADGSIDTPATFSAYQRGLAGGADPRPWEPFGTSRWGETWDVITDRASLSALERYEVVVLATGAPMSDALVGTIDQYVQAGGTVVLNAKQLGANATTLAGLQLTTSRATATSEVWAADGSTIAESSYAYTIGSATTATTIAQTSGHPIVTKNVRGSGAVYVTLPDFMSDASGSQILNVGQKLLDGLESTVAPVQVSGPPLEYLVNTDGGRVIVTLVNTDLGGAAWTGSLSFRQPSTASSVEEWTADVPVAGSAQNGHIFVDAAVPAYDVRVYVLDPGGP
jgi:hypothetical protein